MEKFTPLAKKFTLPPAVTAVTNLTSAGYQPKTDLIFGLKPFHLVLVCIVEKYVHQKTIQIKFFRQIESIVPIHREAPS